jgi:hypothetical protein
MRSFNIYRQVAYFSWAIRGGLLSLLHFRRTYIGL